ncbi:hypothetical protein [Dokdonella ginsengisoli]|uniref:DUF3379 domain-containing protein n=1 Tax=Dokdonella ginsengisoli TaxID=363846 RepID=A0ABV9R084_9GAMM
MNSPLSLADALRALPQAEAQPDLWPDLARSLRARQRRPWRYALPAALAAAIALFALAPRLTTTGSGAPATPPETATQAAATPSAASELSALHERSQALERWIATATVAPLDSRDLMAAVEVEDLIGLVDVQLGATRGDADALPLWRQRVALLEDLATIRVNRYAIAAN